MIPFVKLKEPGEHAFYCTGGAGTIEAILNIPSPPFKEALALVGHPHSLQGGTMQNKVVTTTVRAFQAMGIPAIRFNFRGVGKSEGQFDNGIGESEDMLMLMQAWVQENPHTTLFFAGFSFGSYVAYRAAAQCQLGSLLTIAPPIHHFNYEAFSFLPKPWFIIQGEQDAIVPLEVVLDFVGKHSMIRLSRFPDTGHFFHGKLLDLKAEIMALADFGG